MNIAIKMLFLFLFLDSGYLVYFNSFYGEAPTLIFLLLSFVLLVYLEKGKSSLLIIIALIGSLFLFSGSKPANFPSALLLTLPLVYHVLRREEGRKRFFLCACIAAMLMGASGYVKHTPDWMNKVTTFHAVFFGVLYDHPAPEEAVKELGLPPELSQLEAVNAYAHEPLNPYNLYDSSFQSLFFDRTGKLDVLLYYLKHPALFAEKLDMSAEAALPLRPTYLTNKEVPSEQADLWFAFRLNAWESVRKHFSGFASLFIGAVMGLSMVNLILHLRRRTSLFGILLRAVLICATVGQFIIPMVSNGHADLQKHMFLFNVHLDLLILVIVMDRAGFFLRHFRQIGLALLFLCLLTSFPGKPETITLGRLEGKPIEWYVLERRDEQVKLIAKDSLFRTSYDERSNDYTKAGIQTELDDKVSTWFSQEERELIQKANYSALRNASNASLADEGDRPHYWFSPIKYAAQNSDRAYRTAYSAYMTLPSIDDVQRLFRLSKSASILPESYWLSTAYFSSTDKARMVSPDYQVYHRRVDTELGVRPVQWVKDSILYSKKGSLD
ncbi:hypothetical protein [Gorillibacterium sp. CAU 1737]|uniref:glycan biosynthesis hexose transferase WsfD n=1 Tax=Gorillibacterium sp. CAU 1737 TaxID=3140362 RepID=UPI0032602E73